MENTELAVAVETETLPAIAPVQSFETLMEMSKMLSNSTIVPANYQRRPENVFIALEMANRMGVPVMMVMQNLYVVQGKPSWSGSAVASMIKSHPNLENVELHYVGKQGTPEWGAYVTAISKTTGKELKGATVTMAVANAEGWVQKPGSKWKTIPELMLAYRAYSWFGRVHCSEVMMGLQSIEEVNDVETSYQKTTVVNPFETTSDE